MSKITDRIKARQAAEAHRERMAEFDRMRRQSDEDKREYDRLHREHQARMDQLSIITQFACSMPLFLGMTEEQCKKAGADHKARVDRMMKEAGLKTETPRLRAVK